VQQHQLLFRIMVEWHISIQVLNQHTKDGQHSIIEVVNYNIERETLHNLTFDPDQK
jgi:hypothetical protein